MVVVRDSGVIIASRAAFCQRTPESPSAPYSSSETFPISWLSRCLAQVTGCGGVSNLLGEAVQNTSSDLSFTALTLGSFLKGCWQT